MPSMEEDYGSVPIASYVQKVDAASKQARPADRREIARLVVLLFTAVKTCQEAFLRDKNESSKDNHDAWRVSVRMLLSVIESLDMTLHILAPDVYASVMMYARSELESDESGGSGETASLFINFIWGEDAAEGDFEVVISRLGEFIRDNFTMEEIFEFTR